MLAPAPLPLGSKHDEYGAGAFTDLRGHGFDARIEGGRALFPLLRDLVARLALDREPPLEVLQLLEAEHATELVVQNTPGGPTGLAVSSAPFAFC